MIDLATGWIEIHTAPSARHGRILNQVELAWVTCYSLPNKVMVDRGNEFIAKFRQKIIDGHSMKVGPISSRSSQANTILERVHQIIGNTQHTIKEQNTLLDDKKSQDGILASNMFALRATVHTTMQYTLPN